jgi:hypothetical protein
MKISTHVILQILLLIAQYGNLVMGMAPPKVQPFVALALSAAQGALAWYNHYYTPQGAKIIQ